VKDLIAFRALAVLAAFAIACSQDASPRKRGAASSRRTQDSAAGTVDLGHTTYRPGTLSAVGTVSGVITLEDVAPTSAATVPTDQRVCGTTVEPMIEPGAKGLSNTVVWIADVDAGKKLPVERRIVVASEKCALNPRVQATIVGSAVNVFNDDRLFHTLVFTRAGTNDTLTTMPFFNIGQVVASERLAKTSGVVEIRCKQHPWTRGYIAVFDHPYFAVTEKDGAFKIDSLPPGSYKLMVWHEGASKPIERQVTIAANGVAKVDMPVALGATR
jgi:hypothetical protein